MNVQLSSRDARSNRPRRLRRFLVCFLYAGGCALAALAAAQPGCASGTEGGITGRTGPFAARAERKAGPQPESEWNKTRLWRKIGDAPATYIPRAYPVTASRGDSAGKWITDQRDGKRLFVPRHPVGGLTPGVFEGEALNATNWEYGYFRADSRAAGEGSLPMLRKLPAPIVRGG